MPCDPLPFTPGEGPFRVRGLVYKGYLDSIEARTPGGLAAAKAELAAAERDFLARIFLASTYYDQGPLVRLVTVAARLEGAPLPAFIRERCKRAAQHDVPTIYAHVLKTTSPEAMAERLPRIFERYFEPCRAEMLACADQRGRFRFTGVPEACADWYLWSNQGFMAHSLALAGALAPRIDLIEQRPDGERGGLRLVALTMEASWSRASASS